LIQLAGGIPSGAPEGAINAQTARPSQVIPVVQGRSQSGGQSTGQGNRVDGLRRPGSSSAQASETAGDIGRLQFEVARLRDDKIQAENNCAEVCC
jgi:hypothetical protein